MGVVLGFLTPFSRVEWSAVWGESDSWSVLRSLEFDVRRRGAVGNGMDLQPATQHSGSRSRLNSEEARGAGKGQDGEDN